VVVVGVGSGASGAMARRFVVDRAFSGALSARELYDRSIQQLVKSTFEVWWGVLCCAFVARSINHQCLSVLLLVWWPLQGGTFCVIVNGAARSGKTHTLIGNEPVQQLLPSASASSAAAARKPPAPQPQPQPQPAPGKAGSGSGVGLMARALYDMWSGVYCTLPHLPAAHCSLPPLFCRFTFFVVDMRDSE
jgi:hypothetical protein